MNKLQPIYAVLFTLFLLYAFSSNPTNSNTGAPGDSNCTSCHGNPNSTFDGAVSIKGLPSDIIPGTTYKVSVVSKVTAGNPTRAGFQMVVLDGAANNAGNLMNPGNSSTVTSANGRNYFEHNPALSFNGIDSVSWSVDWTAPNSIGSDSIKIYINSILGNGSGSSNDLMVSSQTTYNFQTITADPILVNIVSSDISCFGETDGAATVNASGGSGVFTYQWSNDSTITTIDSLGIGRYVVTVTDSDGASETASVIIEQPTPIQVTMDNVVNVSCDRSMGQATAIVTGGVGLYSFLWSTNNDFTTATETLPSGTHSVTVVDGNQCSGIAMVTIEEDTRAPVVFAGFDVTLTCNDASTTTQLEAFNTTTGTGVTYLWTTTDGNIVSGETSLTPIVDASGTYVLTVTLGTNGCFASDSTVVSIDNELPIANAGMDQKIDCENAFVILDGNASSQGANLIYSWTTPDGSIISIENPLMPTVSSAGTYTLTVTNSLTGCMATDDIIVTQDTEMPSVSITPSNLLNCFNTTVILNGSNSTAENFTYLWTTTDGNIISGNNTLTIEVAAAGTYTLTTTNTANNCSSIIATTVADNRTAPTVNAGESALLTCGTTSLVLAGTGDANPEISYNWTTSGGNIVNGATTLNPTINAPGFYTISATNPATGCTTTTQVQILADTLSPTANAGNTLQLNCDNPTVVLNGNASSSGNNFTYNWTTVDGVILSGTNTMMPTVSSAGTYTLTVTNTLNGCTAMASVNVTQDTQLPIISAGETAVLTCSTSNLVLAGVGDTADSAITYSWATTDGNIVSGATTLTPTINAAGTYTLKATNTLTGCSISDQVIILADVTLTSVDAGNNQQLDCNNSTVILSGTGTVGATYLWSTENGNILSGDSTLTPVVDAAGVYTLTVTNPISGCATAASVEVLADMAIPMVEIGAAAASFCDNNTLALSATASIGDNFTYFWCTEDGSILSGAETLEVVIDGGGLFEFIVTNTSNGCKNADTVIVTALESPMLMLENDTSLNVTGGTLPYNYNWSVDGNVTDIGSLNNLIPGEYDVTITDANGCMDDIQFTIEMITGLSALDEQIESISLFPNPTPDYLTVNIDFNHTQTGAIFIRNNIGQQVWQQPFSDKNINLEIDVMDWSTGIYYMIIQTEEGVKTAEILVTK